MLALDRALMINQSWSLHLPWGHSRLMDDMADLFLELPPYPVILSMLLDLSRFSS